MHLLSHQSLSRTLFLVASPSSSSSIRLIRKSSLLFKQSFSSLSPASTSPDITPVLDPNPHGTLETPLLEPKLKLNEKYQNCLNLLEKEQSDRISVSDPNPSSSSSLSPLQLEARQLCLHAVRQCIPIRASTLALGYIRSLEAIQGLEAIATTAGLLPSLFQVFLAAATRDLRRWAQAGGTAATQANLLAALGYAIRLAHAGHLASLDTLLSPLIKLVVMNGDVGLVKWLVPCDSVSSREDGDRILSLNYVGNEKMPSEPIGEEKEPEPSRERPFRLRLSALPSSLVAESEALLSHLASAYSAGSKGLDATLLQYAHYLPLSVSLAYAFEGLQRAERRSAVLASFLASLQPRVHARLPNFRRHFILSSAVAAVRLSAGASPAADFNAFCTLLSGLMRTRGGGGNHTGVSHPNPSSPSSSESNDLAYFKDIQGTTVWQPYFSTLVHRHFLVLSRSLGAYKLAIDYFRAFCLSDPRARYDPSLNALLLNTLICKGQMTAAIKTFQFLEEHVTQVTETEAYHVALLHAKQRRGAQRQEMRERVTRAFLSRQEGEATEEEIESEQEEQEHEEEEQVSMDASVSDPNSLPILNYDPMIIPLSPLIHGLVMSGKFNLALELFKKYVISSSHETTAPMEDNEAENEMVHVHPLDTTNATRDTTSPFMARRHAMPFEAKLKTTMVFDLLLRGLCSEIGGMETATDVHVTRQLLQWSFEHLPKACANQLKYQDLPERLLARLSKMSKEWTVDAADPHQAALAANRAWIVSKMRHVKKLPPPPTYFLYDWSNMKTYVHTLI